MDILWLDDDAPTKPIKFGNVDIKTASSCSEAEQLLKGETLPQWIIIDLIVPQGDWGETYFAVPGLEFVKFISTNYGGKIQIAVLSIVITPEMGEKLRLAGASKVYVKTNISFGEIIQDLIQIEESSARQNEASVHGTDKVDSYETLLRQKLETIIQQLLNRQYLSSHALTAQEVAELHQAKLALEIDSERRLRSYQTLAAIKNLLEVPPSNAVRGYQDELNQLRSTVDLIINRGVVINAKIRQ